MAYMYHRRTGQPPCLQEFADARRGLGIVALSSCWLEHAALHVDDDQGGLDHGDALCRVEGHFWGFSLSIRLIPISPQYCILHDQNLATVQDA